jgi:hypothetical protein
MGVSLKGMLAESQCLGIKVSETAHDDLVPHAPERCPKVATVEFITLEFGTLVARTCDEHAAKFPTEFDRDGVTVHIAGIRVFHDDMLGDMKDEN